MPCSIEDLVNGVDVQLVIDQLCLVQSYSCSIASCSMIFLFNSFVQFSMFNVELFNWPERHESWMEMDDAFSEAQTLVFSRFY